MSFPKDFPRTQQYESPAGAGHGGEGRMPERLVLKRKTLAEGPLRQIPDQAPSASCTGQHYALDQRRAPLFSALEAYRKRRIVAFDVPGHKQGRGNPELTDFLGERCLSVDVNSMKPLDNLIHPISVIRDAQALAADAFGADHAFFMVNGTSGAVQAMVCSTVRSGETIIMPRNVHRSAINALILSGALPVYVDPGIDEELGIPLGMSREAVEAAILAHPEAKAVLVNNPTYYGVCADLKSIIEMAHAHGMKVLVDEAHGTHFYFGKGLPPAAMHLGADMAAVSLHKTGGSLTQSSLLLSSAAVDANYVAQVINLSQTTSASYLLMSSLDISRRNLALFGESIYERVVELADYGRRELELIGGYLPFSSKFCDGDAFFAFDRSKLSVHTRQLGLSGLEVYDILRDEYSIQIEFGDLGNILAVLSVGDRAAALERLLSALNEIKRRHPGREASELPSEYIEPCPRISPREAFYADKESVRLEDSLGRVAAEFVMCYPPGIPIVAPGEEINDEILNYIDSARRHGASMTGPRDHSLEYIDVLSEATLRAKPSKLSGSGYRL
ncbi:MAG: aminotransferase class I/II-fold pyridoxal phosphate-dependent enzyme [Eubacteriales bacterium]|nr:aminotransferase class I/II-fold pyridoxal phosphate-dependent enzyme [Eubacteriales bacterium]